MEIAAEVLIILVKANLKLRYISEIRISETYDIFTKINKPLLTIEIFKYSYADLIKSILKDYPTKIEIIYLGEYTGNTHVPKNIWVKMNKEEQEEHLSRKDPCLDCKLFKETCILKECQFFK